jgi:hypothetical protein
MFRYFHLLWYYPSFFFFFYIYLTKFQKNERFREANEIFSNLTKLVKNFLGKFN